jgi:hypothetical protein
MKAVHVLPGIDGSLDPGGINVGWERQLNQDPVNGIVVVQFLDLCDEEIFRSVAGKIQVRRVESGLRARLFLVADVNL